MQGAASLAASPAAMALHAAFERLPDDGAILIASEALEGANVLASRWWEVAGDETVSLRKGGGPARNTADTAAAARPHRSTRAHAR